MCSVLCVCERLWALDVVAVADEVKENKEIGLLCVCGFRCFDSLLGKNMDSTPPSPLPPLPPLPLPPSTVRHSIEIISLSVLLPNKSFWVSAALPRSFGWCASLGGEKVFGTRTMRKWAVECVGPGRLQRPMNNAVDDDYHRSVYKFHCSHFRRVDIRPIAINYYYREAENLSFLVVQSASPHANHTFHSGRKSTASELASTLQLPTANTSIC